LSACCCALPGKIDRKNGVGISFGNLSWRNVPIKKDLERLLGFTQVWLEHDSSLAGLSEAELTHGRYRKIIYLTISTGIGDGIIIDDKIDTDLADSEAGQMVLEHDGKLQKWASDIRVSLKAGSGTLPRRVFGTGRSDREDEEKKSHPHIAARYHNHFLPLFYVLSVSLLFRIRWPGYWGPYGPWGPFPWE